MITVEVRGKDQLFRALNKSIPGVNQELKAELAKTGEEFAGTARRFAPRGVTGELLASINWVWTKNTQADNSRSPAIVVMAGATPENSDPYYAHFVEFGTENTPKQPFFFPAYRIVRKRFNARVAAAIRRAKKKAGLG